MKNYANDGAGHDEGVPAGAASSLFRAGRYRDCIECCRTSPSRDDDVVRRHALLRLRDYAAALDGCLAAQSSAPSPQNRISLIAVAAMALGSMGRFDEADDALRSISHADLASAGRDCISDHAYARAFVAWMAGSAKDADDALRAADHSYAPTAEARAKILRSWIYSLRGQYLEQAKLLSDAIRTSLTAESPDVGMIARALQSLSALAREMHLPHVMPLAASLLSNLRWTDDLRYEHLQTRRNVGWSYALEGNYIQGIRLLDAAKRLADGPYQTLLASLDHAHVAGIAGQSVVHQAGLLECADLMDALGSSTTGEEMMALVVAAEAFCETDLSRSISALKLFEGARKSMAADFALRNHPHAEGMYRFACGLVAAQRGRLSDAVRDAKRAFELFDRIGYAWRASRAAALTYRCTGEDEWLHEATVRARAYARGFIAREMEALFANSANRLTRELTPRQRQIALLLAEGLTVEQTARRLNASPNTIKVHKNRIYHALGVRNRVELAKEAAKIAV